MWVHYVSVHSMWVYYVGVHSVLVHYVGVHRMYMQCVGEGKVFGYMWVCYVGATCGRGCNVWVMIKCIRVYCVVAVCCCFHFTTTKGKL